jgi:hypothetical protein
LDSNGGAFLVAENENSLWNTENESLQNAIKYFENGEETDSNRAWTGTLASGDLSSLNCSDWEQIAPFTGLRGRPKAKTTEWISIGDTTCSTESRLFCISQ